MPKLLHAIALICSLLCSQQSQAQQPLNQINIITFNVKNKLPADVGSWNNSPAAVILVAQKMPQVNIQGAKLLVQIRQAGTKLCGSNLQSSSIIDSFTIRNFSTAEITNGLTQCPKLTAGSYSLCVQFFNVDRYPISKEVCKDFIVEDAVQIQQSFTPPQNTFPANDKKFTEAELKLPITFRWTPVVPKPRESVTYRLKVWQLMQGQNSTQAMRSNQPIVEKDVANLTQAVINNIYTGPCKPPYLCDYIWMVQAVDKEGKPIGSNSGNSEPTSFSMSNCSPEYELKFDSVYCGQDGKVHVQGHVAITPKIGITINSVQLTALNINNYLGAAVPTTLTLPSTLTAAGNNYPFSFIVNVDMCNKKLFVGYTINSFCNSTGITSPTYCADSIAMPCCKCNLCDSSIVKWTLPQQIKFDSTTTNNTATLYGAISFGPYPIVKLSTEIVDFYWYTEGDCKKCSNNDFYWGNLVSGNIGGMMGTSVADAAGTPIPSSHQLDFISNTLNGIMLNNTLNLNISLPPQTQLSCCTDCFRFCIRYTATFMHNGVCKTCSIVKCYEVKRTHKKIGKQIFINQCGESGVIVSNGDIPIKD